MSLVVIPTVFILFRSTLVRDGRRPKTTIQAVIRRGIRSGLCEQHHKTVEELVEEADDKLFTNVMYNKQHVGTSYTSWYHGHKISP